MCPEVSDGDYGHAKVGCVATAMGMIMHYWGYPSHGMGTWNGVNFGETTYNWENMPNQLDQNSTQEEVNAVATLLRQCGASVGMDYGAESSGALYNSVEFGLEHCFGYEFNAQHRWNNFDDWLLLIKSNLLINKPIYYSGNDDNGAGGHAWVCDGFDENDLLHFNWGWNGLDNGYFALGAFNVGFQFNHWHYAVFDIQPPCNTDTIYNITTSNNLLEGGTVIGNGTFSCGQICNLIATASDGYVFVNWTENGNVVSSEADYSFEVYSDRNMVANFDVFYAPTSVNIETSTVGGGFVTGGGSYDYGTYCTLIATANENFSFAYWTENGVVISLDSTYSFSATEDRSLVAHFSDSGSSCDIAIELYSYYGNGWDDGALEVLYNDTTSEQLTLGNGSSTASFIRSVENGSHVVLLYYPPSGIISGALSVKVSYANGIPIWQLFNSASTAQFEFDIDCENAYLPRNILATSNPSEGGIITGSGTYEAGETCVLSAIPNQGYSFANWTENGETISEDAMLVFNVSADRNIEAHFSLPLVVNVTSNTVNGGAVSGSGSYIYGQNCTVAAEPNPEFSFYSWTENGEIISTDLMYTFKVTANRNIVANFGPALNIVVGLSPNEGGTVTGDGIYNYNQLCILNANANEGFRFKQWEEDGEIISRNSNLFFNVTEPRNLTAVFDENVDTISGLLNGLFSISEEKQIGFSKGNLQYIGSATEPFWKFAEHQYDYLGDNGQCSTAENVDRDLFGWGTSGYNHGATSYQPWSTSENDFDYQVYGSDQYNLFDQTGQADWGYNAISNGGDMENQWRTLTVGEWEYLFDLRNTQSGIRYAKANVNGVNGVILLPDNWNTSVYELNNGNEGLAHFDGNIITEESWSLLESAGAVFLPACGIRDNTTGYYFNWEGKYASANSALTVIFTDSYLYSNIWSTRYQGYSVRLVRFTAPARYMISAVPNSGETGVVEGGGLYDENATATLTATPNPGYLFSHWSDGSTENPRTITVTGDMTLTAYFVEDLVNVAAMSNEPAMGTVLGGGSYPRNSEVTLAAVAKQGFSFLGWDNGVPDNPYTFTVSDDISLTALFAAHDTTYIDVHDTTYVDVHDTTYIDVHDTTYVDVYVPVHDTTYIDVHDTTYLWQYDTTYVDVPYPVHDTTYVDVHDTTYLWQYDTTYVNVPYPVHDTTYVDVHDTTYLWQYDTTYINVPYPVHDTTYVTLTDTIVLNHYDTTYITLHDTITITEPLTWYSLQVLSEDMDKGVGAGSGQFPEGTDVEIAAIPVEGYRFLQWSDGSEANPRTITLNENLTLTAMFTTVGVTDLELPTWYVYPEQGAFVVKGTGGHQVSVYDAVGKLLHRYSDAPEILRYSVPAAGSYYIQVDNGAAKKVTVVR